MALELETLTEPLLPRGREAYPTAPLDDSAAAPASTPPAHRHAINQALAPAPAAKSPAAATTGALASPSHPAAQSPGASANFASLALAAAAGSAATAGALTSSSALTGPRSASVGAAGSSTDAAAPNSTPASPSHGAGLSSPDGASPPRPSTPSGANAVLDKSIQDKFRPTAPPATSSPRPVGAGYASPSILRGRNSPRTMDDDIFPEAESVHGDRAVTDSSRPIGVEHSRTRTAPTRRGRRRSSFPITRGRRYSHRPVPRSKSAPHTDSWSKESFMYTCVLMLFAGLITYLGTMFDGWLPYLRGIFIVIFGVATGFACTGVMALVSETPDIFSHHFAHIVSRLTFIAVSLAFEAAVFFLLGEAGFIIWLLVAAFTVFGMIYFWRAGH